MDTFTYLFDFAALLRKSLMIAETVMRPENAPHYAC